MKLINELDYDFYNSCMHAQSHLNHLISTTAIIKQRLDCYKMSESLEFQTATLQSIF